tara:strand:+ start:6923 stop:8080 length:1158 start_codon:yes stop_codon:yes gene_type:complete
MKKLKKYKHFQLFGDCCWGLQKMVAQYEGPALRVRRGIDNVEQDIYFTGKKPGCWIDEKELLDFVGHNSDGFVTKMYDQQDNRRNWLSVFVDGSVDSSHKTDIYQSTASRQPLIVNDEGAGVPGSIFRNLYGEPCIKGDTSRTVVRMTFVRKFEEMSGILMGGRFQRTDQPSSDSYIISANFTSSKNQVIDEEDASEIKGGAFGRPAVMQGTDSNYYYCIKDGSPYANRRPITGVDYTIYWASNPVGNSFDNLLDYDTAPSIYNYSCNPSVTFFEDGVEHTYTVGTFEEITRDRNLALDYVRGVDYDKKIKSNTNQKVPLYSWALDYTTNLVDEAATPYNTTAHGYFASKVDLYNNFYMSREEYNGAFCIGIFDNLNAVLRSREV